MSTKEVNNKRLFLAACVSLIVTAMTFGVRAGILGQLGVDFALTDTQLGFVNSMAFLGFPIATVIGGLVYNSVGPKKLMAVAFICHILGLVMTIMATGYWTLLISTFFIGFANGSVEAACNPMIADMYTKKRTAMLNKFHMWFPGGIVVGALASKFMTDAGMGWQIQISIMLIPTILYGILFFGQIFPKSENIVSDTKENIKNVFTPLFLFIFVCMSLTAISEFGPQQWVERILSSTGASPMLVLAMITGLMAIGRYFGGAVLKKINPPAILLISAVVATIAIYLMSSATGGMVYVAAVLFAIGVMYFWPTMIGFVAEYIPKSGALGMSLVGGVGMLSTAIWQPVIGNWLDGARETAIASGISEESADLVAGQSTLGNMVWFPVILIVLFGILFFMRNKVEEGRVAQEGH
ncbi:MAG: MFS transporter [Flavobacteriaceae bacterium]|nr:MAG: MFS transporter [Flavobacteriaceae bacterium]